MNHFALLLICVLSVEFLVYCNFLFLLNSILHVTKKVINILPNKNISDHWKEVAIPAYSLSIMGSSLKILLILLCIFSFFVTADILLTNFLELILSFEGIIESVGFTILYFFFKKIISK